MELPQLDKETAMKIHYHPASMLLNDERQKSFPLQSEKRQGGPLHLFY